MSAARGSVNLTRDTTHSPIRDVTQVRSVPPQPAHAGALADTVGDPPSAALLNVFSRVG